MKKQRKYLLFLFFIVLAGLISIASLLYFYSLFSHSATSQKNPFPFSKQQSFGKKNLPTETPTGTPTITPTATPSPIPVGLPNQIEIPKIKIATSIIPVGTTNENNIDVPKDANTVGWFSDTVQPGQIGISILSGHYDTPSGRPAVFYSLKKLLPGDLIHISTAKNLRLTFTVTEIMNQSEENFSPAALYARSQEQELRLITCDGVWNRQVGSYSDRLIIFAKLTYEEKI